MAKRDNPNIRYTFLSIEDLKGIDRKTLNEPIWTCTKEMALHAMAYRTLANVYQIKKNRQIHYCLSGFDISTKTWHSFVVYDKKGCVKKGNLYTIMDFFDIDSTDNYYDVSNIDEKPELFLDIYKVNNFVTLSESLTPQQLADYTLNAALEGFEWAKDVLKKPVNPIKIICKKENITRPQLAKKTGIKLSVLENCVSRNACSKMVLDNLRKYYNYI